MGNFKKIGGGLKKLTTLFIIIFLLFNLFMINLEPMSFTQHANALRYDMDTNLTYSDSSFIGGPHDWVGQSIASGDVNGDGYNDILIGSTGYNQTNGSKGKVNLIFGKGSGWDMDLNLSKADASFVGEYNGDSASTVAIAGDVNGDGYDDILIGAYRNREGGVHPNSSAYGAGQIYLIFGKASGWSMDTNLSTANASFIGQNASDGVGRYIDGAGDVNGDGYDDILIGIDNNDEGGFAAGQAYLIFGKSSGWTMDNNLSNSDASFLGEYDFDYVGGRVAGVGDVNADGLDDILIYGEDNHGPTWEQKAYLIYGKTSGWAMDTKISEANVTFVEVWGAISFDGVGDVNGDGINDMIIGCDDHSEFGNRVGKTYIIFGQTAGWSKRTYLSSINASFIGEKIWYRAGIEVGGGGDVNGDGYDDILISTQYPGRRKNEVYLVLGKASGWSNNTNLSTADASFITETPMEFWSLKNILIAGDVNGDGFDDILIAATLNPEGGNNSGQVYLIFPELDKGPNVVNSVKVYSDASFTNEIDIAEIGDIVYVELIGTDKNASHFDNAAVNISSTSSSPKGFQLYLLETGFNTGKFRGSFKISNRTHRHLKLINATIGENIIISSVMDPTKNTTILVTTMVQLGPQQDNTIATEDEEYFMHYWNFGYNPVSAWTFETNASWLTWNEAKHDIYGTPDNGDVGTFWVRLNITDGLCNFDEHNFTITVYNTPPEITTENILIAMEDELYFVDYTSSDDGNGTITWNLQTNASWLEIADLSGELSGIPNNDDRGTYWVNVSVDDGNSGTDWSKFEITVLDTNDAPVIITENVTIINEDSFYYVIYNATDIDGDVNFEWHLDTNASWLNMNTDTGELHGTPSNDDVGISYVNVTVSDAREGSDSQNFTLEVLNVNDPPEWVTVPTDGEINECDIFLFDVDATDVDSGDILRYNLISNPQTNITINYTTGMIEWTAYIEDLVAPQYILKVILSVTDGNVTIWNSFELTVIPNSHPTTRLLSPANNSIVSTKGTEFKWEGHDSENEFLTYDLYLSYDEISVRAFSDTVKVLSNTNATSHLIRDLTAGGIYYWTVIPNDWLNYGECVDGVFSFKINSPPRINPIPSQKATVGIEFQLEIEASDSNPDDVLNFEYTLELVPEGMTINSSTGVIIWTPTKAQVGLHTVSVWVSDGLDLANTSFEIEVSEEAVVEGKASRSFVIVTISFIILIVILTSFISATEVGKYKFLSLFFVPLYNRLHPDNIFDNYARGQIHGYIKAKPGEHYNAIKSALKLKNGTLTHHTKVLAKEGLIRIKREGIYTRFYPAGTNAGIPETPLLMESQEEIMDIIRHQPGITQNEILKYIELGQSTVSYNLTSLIRNKLITVDKSGRENRYFINDRTLESSKAQDQAQGQAQARLDNSAQSQSSEPMIEHETNFSGDSEHKKDG